jgi:hypothetical protein
MALVKLEWYRKTAPEKLLKTEYIIQQMTANVATYATPNPDLADVEAARLNLNKAAVTALAGGVALTLAKNEAEDVLDELITQLIPYVQNVSGGIEALILKGGMEVRKSSSPIPQKGFRILMHSHLVTRKRLTLTGMD